MLRVAFAGTPEFAVPTLQALHNHPEIHVECVLTQPDRRSGRGRQLSESAVKHCAQSLQIPIFQPENLKSSEQQKWLQSLNLDAMIVVAYGQILTPAILDTPRLGCFNVHASLLPRWRGAAPLQRAIEAGDHQTGITIMRMDAGLDTGPMLSWQSVEINASTTTQVLHDTLATIGGDLLTDSLIDYAQGKVALREQPTVGITYAHKISTTDALIDWHQPAEKIRCAIHAFNPVPGAYSYALDTRLKLFRAEDTALTNDGPPGWISMTDDRQILVNTGSGCLKILEGQLAGGQRLDAQQMAQQTHAPWTHGCQLASEAS